MPCTRRTASSVRRPRFRSSPVLDCPQDPAAIIPAFAKADAWFGLLGVIVFIAGFAFSLGPVFWP
jgi:hypothetical protein